MGQELTTRAHQNKSDKKLRQISPFEGEFSTVLESKGHCCNLEKKYGGMPEEVGWLRYWGKPGYPKNCKNFKSEYITQNNISLTSNYSRQE